MILVLQLFKTDKHYIVSKRFYLPASLLLTSCTTARENTEPLGAVKPLISSNYSHFHPDLER